MGNAWGNIGFASLMTIVSLGLLSCASGTNETAIDPTQPALDETVILDDSAIETEEASCKSIYTQIYRPPLKLGGAGRVINVKSGESCESVTDSVMPIKREPSKAASYTPPKEYLPPPVFSFCLSRFDVLVSLKVLKVENIGKNTQLFILTIKPVNEDNRGWPVAPNARELSDKIGIGYISDANGFEIIQINELLQSESLSNGTGLTYEILAKLPDKIPKYLDSPNFVPRYQVFLTNWHKKNMFRVASDFQCPVLYLKESRGLQVNYD